MTFRAVLLGLLGAVLIAVVGYVQRYFGALTNLTRGHFPIAVFGALFVVMAGVNPALSRIKAGLQFRPGELAVVLAFAMVGCNLPDAGLMRHFTQAVATPSTDYQTRPHWQKAGLLGYAPPVMLLAGGNAAAPALQKLVGGRRGDPTFGIHDVPWSDWLRLMAFWGPMILMFAAASVCLVLAVHRNWCNRERLRYPIAEFANVLIDQGGNPGAGSIFRNRLFWTGLIALLAIRVVNGLYMWFPQEMIRIRLEFNFTDKISPAFPSFMATPNASYIATPAIFPTAVVLAFFLAGDISFSLGVSNLLSVTAMYFMIRAGVKMSSETSLGGFNEWLAFGAFVGFALTLVYIGRRHYWINLRQAISLVGHPEADRDAVWATRAFLLCSAGMAAMLTAAGLSWIIAATAVAAVILMHFVMARMSAECGVFFFVPAWSVIGVLLGLFGLAATGPGPIVIVAVFVGALSAAPWECLMPYVANGLRITESVRIRPGPVAGGAVVAFALALLVVLPVGLWCIYYYGQQDSIVRPWWDEAARSVTRLSNLGTLEQVNAMTSWDRIVHFRPEPEFTLAAGAGLVLVLLCGALRLRFTWWPLHPVIFLVFGSWTMGKYSPSFLLGWLLKLGVSHFGGSRGYHRALPLLAGVIAGDVMGGSIFMLANVLYYFATGVAGPEYVKSYIL